MHLNSSATFLRTGKFGDGMHEFVCRKNAQGEVRLYVRKSSKASGWFPEGNGMPIFKTPPSGRPHIADALEDHRWARMQVEGTVREWFRYMTVTQAESQEIRKDWQKRFDSLPPNGKFSMLPDFDELDWKDLPRRTPRQCVAEVDEYVASSTLENPPVNPLTGPGRGSHVVDRELASYQEGLRFRAARHGWVQPVFQADFIFVQLPHKKVALHRVSNGLYIDNATAKDLSFSTIEYTQTPETTALGMDGDLIPAPNPEYDLAKKKRGMTVSIRHHGIGREVIKAYDLEVVTVALPKRGQLPAQTVIRLAPSSKLKLAEIDTSYSYVAPNAADGGAHRAPQASSRARGGGGGMQSSQRERSTRAPAETAQDAGRRLPPNGRHAGGDLLRAPSLYNIPLLSRHATDVEHGVTHHHSFIVCVCVGKKRSRRVVMSSSSEEEISSLEEEEEDESSSSSIGIETCRQSAPTARTEKGVACAGESQGAKHQGQLQQDRGEESESSSGGADERAPIPDGYYVPPTWQPDDPIHSFMLWSPLDTHGPPKWHCLKVVKVLQKHKRFTHDAHVVGRPREKRGVTLTKAMYDEGVLVPLMLGSAPNASIGSNVGGSLHEDRVDSCDGGARITKRQRHTPPRSKVPFFCRECKQSADVLYCDPVSEDGVVPQLMCSGCKPQTWVNISQSDFERVWRLS